MRRTVPFACLLFPFLAVPALWSGGGSPGIESGHSRSVAEVRTGVLSRLEQSVMIPAKDGFPQWDPSGTRIAFRSDRDGNEEIYVMDADGSDVIRLTNEPDSGDYAPFWSPDGTRIVYSALRDGVNYICVMNADGSGRTDLTGDTPYDWYKSWAPDGSKMMDWFESWSPDGSKMVFQSNRDGDYELYVMNTDGTGLLRVTDHPGYDGIARWSPDGSRIAFHSQTAAGNLDIYLMNPDGTGRLRLTDDPGNDQNASWLPDGNRILFQSDRDGRTHIYIMDRDGSHQTRLTDSASDNGNALPSPDGKRIAFQSNRDGDPEIYVMEADGSSPTRLTAPPGRDRQYAWSPDSQKILFSSDRGLAWILDDIFCVQADGSRPVNLTGNDILPGTEVRDIRYGPFESNILDLWLVDSPIPTPLVVFYHGGGFRAGDKRGSMLAPLLRKLMEAGISVAGVNYRLSGVAPYPAQMHDSARALQFLRHHAREYNIDPGRVGATGGSAGAIISMWLAFHDDLADPASDDPVLQQSTRLSAVVPYDSPGSVDPRFLREYFDTKEDHPALLQFFGITGPEEFLDRDKIRLFEEASPINHATADDPPVYMYFNQPNVPLPPGCFGDQYVHHPGLGFILKEKLDQLGVPCVLHLREETPGGTPFDEYVAFFRSNFQMSGK